MTINYQLILFITLFLLLVNNCCVECRKKYVQLPSTVQIKSVDNDQLADRRRIVDGDDIDDEDKLVDEIIETACRELNECLLESTHMLMDCDQQHDKYRSSAVANHANGNIETTEESTEADDDCDEVIEELNRRLKYYRIKRKQQLHECYENGPLTADARETAKTLGRRHQSTCISRMAKLEQVKLKKNEKDDDTSDVQPTTGRLQCRAAAKRYRENCDKLESCCTRAKMCKKETSESSISTEIGAIVKEMKKRRRTCRERSTG